MSTKLAFSDQVRRKLHEDGRSISELARLAGISQPSLSQFASGISYTLRGDHLGSLIEVLGGSLVWKKPPKSKGK